MVNVVEFNNPDDLESLRDPWTVLHRATPQASFFQSLDWLQVYWRHFGRQQRLRVLVVEQDGQPMGIVPLVVRREPTKIGTLRFLTYPLDWWGAFYGPIGPASGAALTAALAHVRNTRRDWDVLELRWVGSSADDIQQTEAALTNQCCQVCRNVVDHTAVVPLCGSWDDYLASHSSKWRNNYRRWMRRVDKLGDVALQRYRPAGDDSGDGDPRWDLYDACMEIARQSWQGASTDGTTLSHESVAAFLREVHAAAARCGGVDLNLLRLDGRPIAFAYNYHWQGRVFGLRVGYDSAVSRDGVGNALYARVLQDSIERGDTEYDFGPGSLHSKRQFRPELRPVYRYSHFPLLGVRSQLLRLKRYLDSRRAAAV